MFRIKYAEYVRSAAPQDVAQLIGQILSMQAGRGSRVAAQHLLEQVGCQLLPIHNESYYAEALHYHLGLLCAYSGQPEKMAWHMEQSHTLPAVGGDVLFSEQVHSSLALHRKCEEARRRGMPPLLLSCMPRAASVTLTQTLTQLFDMPALRLSVGKFPSYYLVPTWCDHFLGGGALLHDHFSIEPHNRALLEARKVKDVFVLVRDPRAAAWSMLCRKYDTVIDPSIREMTQEEELWKAYSKNYLSWFVQWLDYAAQPHPALRVHWITYDEVIRRMPQVVQRISAVLGKDWPAFAKAAKKAPPAMKANFVTGNDDEWRKHAGKELQQKMWSACTPAMIDLLQMAP